MRFIFLLLLSAGCATAGLFSVETSPISGRVFSADSTPVAAAQILLDGNTLLGQTAQNGAYVVSVQKRSFRLHIEATGYKAWQSPKMRASAKPRQFDVYLKKQTFGTECDTCGPAPVIVGKIIDTDSAIVSQARVHAGATAAQDTTDAEGVFSLSVPANVSFLLHIDHPRYTHTATDSLRLQTATIIDTTIVLIPTLPIAQRRARISGQIVDGATQSPLIASLLRLNGDTVAVSDSLGRFTTPYLRPGMHSFIVSAPGYQNKALSYPQLKAADSLFVTTALLPSDATDVQQSIRADVTISVETSNQAPLAGARATLIPLQQSEVSDSSGAITFTAVPFGLYDAIISAPGYDSTTVADIDIWRNDPLSHSITLQKTAAAAPASQSGVAGIKGLVVDAKNAQGLAGAVVFLTGSRKAQTVTDLSGRFAFEALKPGNYAVRVELSGFHTAEQSPVAVAPKAMQTVDFVLRSSDVTELARMSVRSSAVASTGAALLKERQKAVSFTDAIGAQEMSRTGASDAADAMKSVTGATVVGGKYVYIRGLGEQYTLTTLNGSILPSADPDRNAVNMDLFPASVIENITTYKTFTADLPAQFAGGVIDLNTTSYPEKKSFKVSLSTAANSAVTFNSNYENVPGSATDFLGMDNGSRALPQLYEQTSKSEIIDIVSVLNRPLQNPSVVNTYRDRIEAASELSKGLSTDFFPQSQTAYPNFGIKTSFGNSFATDRFEQIGFTASLNYSSSYGLNQAPRNTWVTTGRDDSLINVISFGDNTVADYETAWGLYSNVALKRSDAAAWDLSWLLSQSGNAQSAEYRGTHNEFSPTDTFATTQISWTERTLNYLQLQQKYRFNSQLSAEWKSSFTLSKQNEPDIREYSYILLGLDSVNTAGETVTYFNYETRASNFADPNHKFRTTDVSALTSDIGFDYGFWQWSDDSATFSFGLGTQFSTRSDRTRIFTYETSNYFISNQSDMRVVPEAFLVEENLGVIADSSSPSGIRKGVVIRDDSEGTRNYDQSWFGLHGYMLLELPVISDLVTLTGGARVEMLSAGGSSIEKRYEQDTKFSFNNIDLFPHLGLNVQLRPNMSLRLSSSITVIRPTGRQLASFETESFAGGGSFLGNSELEQYKVYNADSRWEWFFASGEMLAVSGFYKYIDNPFETKFLLNQTTTLENRDQAQVYGLESEARLSLGRFHRALEGFSVSSNVTLALSQVRLNEEDYEQRKIAIADAEQIRPFSGQSPYVVNIFLQYDNPEAEYAASLSYNVFGERLAEIPELHIPYIWEQERHLLNFVTSKSWGALSLSLKATNLLDLINYLDQTEGAAADPVLNTDERFIQRFSGNTYLRKQSNKGTGFSIGLSYSFF